MRLIDADALKFSCGINEDGILYVPFRDIASAPTIDAEHVRHGHWIKKLWFVTCSICDYTSTDKDDEGDYIVLNYCPNCGAKMDGERKENT